MPDLVSIFHHWHRLHPEGAMTDFVDWVEQVSGIRLFEMTTEDEVTFFFRAMGTDSVAAGSLFEGVSSGP